MFPARAGMIRSNYGLSQHQDAAGVPRSRGDDPLLRPDPEVPSDSVPRSRGDDPTISRVFPASRGDDPQCAFASYLG